MLLRYPEVLVLLFFWLRPLTAQMATRLLPTLRCCCIIRSGAYFPPHSVWKFREHPLNAPIYTLHSMCDLYDMIWHDMYALWLKNVTSLSCCNFDRCEPILIFFWHKCYWESNESKIISTSQRHRGTSPNHVKLRADVQNRIRHNMRWYTIGNL